MKIRFCGVTNFLIPLLFLAPNVSVRPLAAEVVILEGSDANGVHCAQTGEATYAHQVLKALQGASSKPVLVLKTAATPACSIATDLVPHVFTTSLAAAVPAFSPSNYSGLYIMSPGGCCNDGRTLVTALDQAAISAFKFVGGNLGIQDFQGGDWTIALGFTAPPADVAGTTPPFATAGGFGGTDGNTVTAAGSALGFTTPPTLGAFAHQGYNMNFFATVGYRALIIPPGGVWPGTAAVPPLGYASVIAKVCPAPVITGASVSPSSLWPPNHKLIEVTVSYTVTAPCGAVSTLTVTSNEGVNDPGSGNTSPDWVVVDNHHVLLRAERDGGGSGRVYTITITATGEGGTSHVSVEVTVAHDQGQ